ncbi:hypothetical protein CDL12_12522 [Handroanthus impetiginosus]|uniref:Uncharacterized protein n=1 Tax=Handroanthus impetiginosus TaxID=429701 RepID=A0A2G9HBG6_9LAMI|nr:hypothetical protein CDL12_12522 [Handroanthus impetiginosus]
MAMANAFPSSSFIAIRSKASESSVALLSFDPPTSMPVNFQFSVSRRFNSFLRK